MRSPIASLCWVFLAPLALAACESTHPEPRMGPQSARYITSAYRPAFRQRIEARERMAAEAAAQEAREQRRAAAEQATRAAVAAARAERAAAAQAELDHAAGTVSPDPASAPPPGHAPARVAPPAVPAVPTEAADVRETADATAARGLPEPLRWAKRDYEQLGSRKPAPPATQRRFLRLRLTELDGTPVKAREVRPVLRSLVGVQDAVLNEATGTAVVVVNPDVDAESVVKRLAGRYRATVVR